MKQARLKLTRGRVLELVEAVDAALGVLSREHEQHSTPQDHPRWRQLRQDVQEIGTLLADIEERPPRWFDLRGTCGSASVTT